jgi:protein-S-isoprenylcysteine O-methyltransferase Ste14
MTTRSSPPPIGERLPRVIPARPAGAAVAACVVVLVVSDLAFSATTDRWVASTSLLLAGAVILFADLVPVRWPYGRLFQLIFGLGCLASAITTALGAA